MVFHKNQDFYFLDSVKFVSDIERIKGFNLVMIFCGPQKQHFKARQIFSSQLIASQKFVKFGQDWSTTKESSLTVSKYDTSMLIRNTAFSKDILSTFHSVVVKEKKNEWSDCHTDFSPQKTSAAHLQDQNFILLIENVKFLCKATAWLCGLCQKVFSTQNVLCYPN